MPSLNFPLEYHHYKHACPEVNLSCITKSPCREPWDEMLKSPSTPFNPFDKLLTPHHDQHLQIDIRPVECNPMFIE